MRSAALIASVGTVAVVVTGCGGSGGSTPAGYRSLSESIGDKLTLHVALPSSYTVSGPTSSGSSTTIRADGPKLRDGAYAHVYIAWALHPDLSPVTVTTQLAGSETATPLSRTVTSPSVNGATATHEIDASYRGDDGVARAVDFAARTSSGALVVAELVGLDHDPHFSPSQIIDSLSISHS